MSGDLFWESQAKQGCCTLEGKKGGGRGESLHQQTNASAGSPGARSPLHLPGHWIPARPSFGSLLWVENERCDPQLVALLRNYRIIRTLACSTDWPVGEVTVGHTIRKWGQAEEADR